MRPIVHRSRILAIGLCAVLLAQGCASATEASPTPNGTESPPPAPTPSARPVAQASPTATPRDEDLSGIDDAAYLDMPVNLEMTTECGLCGTAAWLWNAPRFRLYADGLVLFREPADDPVTAPYRFTRLADEDRAALVRFALDDGGLRGANAHYPGDADDAGSTRFLVHAVELDDGADLTVQIGPVLGGGDPTDIFGNPITDLDRREQLWALADVLGDFDAWLAGRGLRSEPYEPPAFVAAMTETGDDPGDGTWPWSDLPPEAFTESGLWSITLARVTREQALAAAVGPGGARLEDRTGPDGRGTTILVKPLLPGDARPGAFGLRADTVAVTVEADLRVRSLPDVSDASVRHSPLLREGDALYVIDGPVEGSGYRWYEVHQPRTGLTGWVAAADKTGEPWISPYPLPCTLGASPDGVVDRIGHRLMELACYGDQAFTGTRAIARPSDDGLRCPDVAPYWLEPDWLNDAVRCSYDFEWVDAETGTADLLSGGTFHPSVRDEAERLVDAAPAGQLVEVVGRLDHPDARSCVAVGDDPPAPSLVTLECRLVVVITEVRPAP